MSTARAEIVKSQRNNAPNPKEVSPLFKTGTTGFVVGRLDMGGFDASTNPEGIHGLGSSDTVEIAVVNKDGLNNFRDNRKGTLRITSIVLSPSATVTLGTATVVVLKVVRDSASVLANQTLATIAKAGLTANATIVTDLKDGVVLETNDKLVLTVDGNVDGGAVAGTNIFVTVSYVRDLAGSRLDQGDAVA